MKRWIIADTHFYHSQMPYYCGWPEDFTQRLIFNLGCIRGEDCLYHLGDVHFGTYDQLKTILSGTRGHKVLVKGNHDKLTDTKYLEAGFDWICDSVGVKNIIMTHHPLPLYRLPLGGINIHGHTHKAYARGGWRDPQRRSIVYSPDLFNFSPVELNKLEVW
jgi:calcineurin-like phosphoesterase family protein